MTVRLRRLAWGVTWVVGLALLSTPAHAGGLCRSAKCRPMVAAAPAAPLVYAWPMAVGTAAPTPAVSNVAGAEVILVPLGIEVVRGIFGEIRRRNENRQDPLPTPSAEGSDCRLSDPSNTQEDSDITDIKTRLEGIHAKLGTGSTPTVPPAPPTTPTDPPSPQPSVPGVFPAGAKPPAPKDLHDPL